jgi:hypothetical protein
MCFGEYGMGNARLTVCCVVIGSKATATFTSQGGQQEVLTMNGNWFDTSADIVDEAMGGTFPAPPRFHIHDLC